MNNTNRGLNRTLIAVIGLLALVAGAGLIVVATDAAARGAFRKTGPAAAHHVASWLRSTPFSTANADASWEWILVLSVLVLIVVLLLVFIFRQGHGHDETLLREDTSDAGATIVDTRLAEQAIRADLEGVPEILASSVTSYRVRKTVVLKVSATCRRGASPRQVAHVIEQSLTALDDLLGYRAPALIQLSGGFRARLSNARRAR